MSNLQRPSPSAEGHHGEMSSPSKCDAVFAANRSTRITNTEFRVLVCIIDGLCKRSDIAKAASVSVPTVARAIAKLVSLEWVKRTEHKGKASDLAADLTRITKDTRITNDTANDETRITPERAARIADARRILDDTATRIASDPSSVDKSLAHIKNAGARGKDNLLTLELEDNHHHHQGEVEILPPVKVLNGSAKSMDGTALAAIIFQQVSSRALDPSRYAGLNSGAARVKTWVQSGADFDQDILPAIREGCVSLERKGSAAQTWTYFDNIVRKHMAQRIANELPIDLSQEALNDQRNRPASTYTPQRRRARSVETEILMRDILDGTPERVG